MSKFAKRLDVHFVAMAAGVAAVAGTTEQADAAIVHSGIVNIPIPVTTNGLYMNVVTGALNEPGNTSGSTVAGWDINPWSSTSLNFFNPAAPAGGVYSRGGGASGVGNLPAGYTIDGTNLWTSGTFSATAGWTANLSSSNNIVGFRFQNEANGNAVHFGWMRISIGATLSTAGRALVEFAYEDQAGVGIPAGAVPTPGSLALLAVGAAGLAGRRRR